MSFTTSFTVTQLADCSQIRITDTSSFTSEAKNTFTSRKITIQKSDGTYIKQDFDFPIGGSNADFVDITNLSEGYAVKVTLTHTSSNPQGGSVYTADDYVALTCYLESGFYSKVQKMIINPKLTQSNDYVRKCQMILIERESAIKAASEEDLTSAQNALDRAQEIIDNETLF